VVPADPVRAAVTAVAESIQGRRKRWRPGIPAEVARLGDAALKPSQGEDFVRWVSGLLTRLDGRCDFRVSPPLRSRDGS